MLNYSVTGQPDIHFVSVVMHNRRLLQGEGQPDIYVYVYIFNRSPLGHELIRQRTQNPTLALTGAGGCLHLTPVPSGRCTGWRGKAQGGCLRKIAVSLMSF